MESLTVTQWCKQSSRVAAEMYYGKRLVKATVYEQHEKGRIARDYAPAYLQNPN
jgi:hypothetical protein